MPMQGQARPRTRRPLSLKVRALQWLAQREHSRVELRDKLLRLLQASQGRRHDDDAGAADGADAGAVTAPGHDTDIPHPSAAATAVDAVLDWLQAQGHLSDGRFVESRVHARLAGHGLRRIEQELQQHGTRLDDDTRRMLAGSEVSRAAALWQRRFGSPAADPAERIRQVRFLVQRGFPPGLAMRLAREGAPAEAGDDRDDGSPDGLR